jgi:hypothetical protein
MKQLVLSAIIIFCAFTLNAQTVTKAENDLIQLSSESFNFGTIPYGKKVYTTFTIKNLTKEPLLINNIATSCGCTDPEWDKAAIEPGKTREVTVGFNGYAEGPFAKTVTVYYSGSTKSKTFTISGTGYKLPEVAAKPNLSLINLKQAF